MNITGKGIGLLLIVGVGGYFAYKHFKKPAVPALGTIPATPTATVPGQLPTTVMGAGYPGQTPVNPALYGGVYPTTGVAPLGYSQATSPAFNPLAQNLVQPNYVYPTVATPNAGVNPSTNIYTALPNSVTGSAQPGMLMGFAGYKA